MKKAFKRVSIPPCPWHKNKNMGYLQFFADADKRDAKGERQLQCKVCGYWYWPDHFGIDPVSKLITKSSDVERAD